MRFKKSPCDEGLLDLVLRLLFAGSYPKCLKKNAHGDLARNCGMGEMFFGKRSVQLYVTQ